MFLTLRFLPALPPPPPSSRSIHFMCKGMSQAEVAHMFGHGFVCFRAFHAATGEHGCD